MRFFRPPNVSDRFEDVNALPDRVHIDSRYWIVEQVPYIAMGAKKLKTLKLFRQYLSMSISEPVLDGRSVS